MSEGSYETKEMEHSGITLARGVTEVSAHIVPIAKGLWAAK